MDGIAQLVEHRKTSLDINLNCNFQMLWEPGVVGSSPTPILLNRLIQQYYFAPFNYETANLDESSNTKGTNSNCTYLSSSILKRYLSAL